MSREGVHAVVLCEDTQTECFIRRFLLRQGWNRHKIRWKTLPAGEGSGLVWVRENFVKELNAYRSRNPRMDTCLIIAADADNLTVEQRIQTFRKASVEAGISFRQEGEKVAFIVPRRNIETWLAYLRGEPVNETDACRKYEDESDCQPQVAVLDEMCRKGVLKPEPAPPSLVSACLEFSRLAG
jgi:hypothetical protein